MMTYTFDPEKEYTYRDMLAPAMAITNQGEATEYFAAMVDYHMTRHGQTRAEAERVQRINLGYYAGYYDHETRVRVEHLFGTAHPIFGAASNGAPTPAEAFEKGRELAAELPPAPAVCR